MTDDQDVTIRVNQVASGSALTDAAAQADRLKAKIAELNNLEKNYSEKGMTTAAASVRAERAPLEKELRGMQREEMAHERAVTREHKEREAMEHRRVARRDRLVRAGAGLVENSVGASPLSGLTSALGGIGGIGAVVATAAIAAAGAAANLYFSENRKDKADQITIGERTSAAAHDRSKRLRYGGAGDMSGAVQATEDALAENLRQNERIQENAKPRWYDPRNWSNNLLGTNIKTFEGAREEKQNIEERKRLEEQKKVAEADRAKRVATETAPMIRAQEMMNRGEMQGARSIQDSVTWLQRKREILKETRDETLATQGADAEISRIQKERAGSYAGFISSRTSGAAAARIATMAAGVIQGGTRNSETGEVVAAIRDTHEEAKGAWRLKDFTKRL